MLASAPERLLILGGTGDARALAEVASARFGKGLEIVVSLAGRTREPALPRGQVRIGGFGGSAGLARYLTENDVRLVVDATHPFAATISANAVEACALAGVPRLVLLRPPWELPPGGRWEEVDDLAEAAAAVRRRSRRCFLTTGASGLDAFAGIDGVYFLVRLLEAPAAPLQLGDHEVVISRPPFSLGSEKALMVEKRIDTLVTKLAGGEATRAKIAAAIELDVPIVVVRRPPPPPGARVETVGAALDWIVGQLAGG